MANYKYNYYMVNGNVLWRQKLNAEYTAEYFEYGEWYKGNLFEEKLNGACYDITEEDALEYIERKCKIKQEQCTCRREEELEF